MATDQSPSEASSLRDLPRLGSLAEAVDLVRRHDELYVRYSKGPEHDLGRVSRDYESGLELPGLSATPLTPQPWWSRPLEDWVARQLCQYAHLKDQAPDERHAWMVTGEVVARGPDNEPLLAGPHFVARADEGAVQEAARWYEEHFEVGSDSTGNGDGRRAPSRYGATSPS